MLSLPVLHTFVKCSINFRFVIFILLISFQDICFDLTRLNNVEPLQDAIQRIEEPGLNNFS